MRKPVVDFIVLAFLLLNVIIFGKALWNDYCDYKIDKKSVQTDMYANVVDKRSYTVLVGKTAIVKYEVTIDLGKEEKTITVPCDVYNGIEKNNDIEVTVFTLGKKITDVKYKTIKVK